MAVEIDTALVTELDVYTQLGLNASVSEPVGQLILAASGAISTYCGRKFAQATYTHYLDGTGQTDLYLDHWPVTISGVSGAGIWEDSSAKFTDSALVEDAVGVDAQGDYRVAQGEKGHGRVVYLGGRWPRGDGNIKAVYRAGYSTIPGPIVNACLMTIERLYRIQKMKLTHVSSESIQAGGGSITVALHDFPVDIKRMLAPWRKVRAY